MIKLFLESTPAHTQGFVQKCFDMTNISAVKDETRLSPILMYIESLNKHKEYLDFFEIGVVRDQRKKIENVAKYVGLAINN